MTDPDKPNEDKFVQHGVEGVIFPDDDDDETDDESNNDQTA